MNWSGTSVLGLMLLVVLGTVSGTAGAVDLKAGVAKAVITPDVPLVLTNGPVATGKDSEIYARALSLNDGSGRLLIITYDLNCLDRATAPLRTRVRDELGIDPARLVLLATHNHNGPIQINPGNFEYGDWLANRLFDLAREAMANEQGPVRLLFGSGHEYNLMSRGNAPVDYEIQTLKVMAGEQPVALLFSQATHPLQSSEDKYGAGHPGFAMDEIEARIPGVQAMYAASCGGNQFPLRPKNVDGVPDVPRGAALPDDVRDRLARAFAKELVEAVLRIDAGPLQDVTGPISSKLEIISLPLAEPISRKEARELAKKFPKDVGLVHYPHPNRNTNWVRVLLDWYDRGVPFPTRTTDLICTDDTFMIHKDDKEMLERFAYAIPDEFQCVYEEVIVSKIGPMAFVAMQGEVVAPIGARIKDKFRRDMPIMVFAYMGEHNLYIPTRELVRQKAYQGIVIQIQYASPVGWAPEVEDDMVNGVVRMVQSVMNE
jgi:neutral ceramidase